MVAVRFRHVLGSTLGEEKADQAPITIRARSLIWKTHPKNGRVAHKERSLFVSRVADGGEERFAGFLLYCLSINTIFLQSLVVYYNLMISERACTHIGSQRV
jgi:hypothetical protein